MNLLVSKAIKIEIKGVVDGKECIANGIDQPRIVNIRPTIKIKTGNYIYNSLGGGEDGVEEKSRDEQNA